MLDFNAMTEKELKIFDLEESIECTRNSIAFHEEEIRDMLEHGSGQYLEEERDLLRQYRDHLKTLLAQLKQLEGEQ